MTMDWMPHRFCLVTPWLIFPMLISDLCICVAYFIISGDLFHEVSIRPDSPYMWQNYSFAIFIRACALTHLMGAIVLYWAVYPIQLGINVFTALVSLYVAYLFKQRRLVIRATLQGKKDATAEYER